MSLCLCCFINYRSDRCNLVWRRPRKRHKLKKIFWVGKTKSYWNACSQNRFPSHYTALNGDMVSAFWIPAPHSCLRTCNGSRPGGSCPWPRSAAKSEKTGVCVIQLDWSDIYQIDESSSQTSYETFTKALSDTSHSKLFNPRKRNQVSHRQKWYQTQSKDNLFRLQSFVFNA